MSYATAVGDGQEAAVQPVVGALPIPETTATALADKDDPINLKLYSGKKLGAMYCYEIATDEMEVVIAAGPEPTDPWIKLGGLIDATTLKADWATTDIAADAKTDWAEADIDTNAEIVTTINAQALEVNLILDGIAANMNTVAGEVNAFITGSTITPS